MKKISVQLDPQRRSVTIGGRSIVLQEKYWQVLQMLAGRAGQVISRADFIETVWQGNYQTGEKGLNQALWALRSALADDARDPEFIRTVPRVGYQWIYTSVESRSTHFRILSWRKAAAIAASAVVLMTTAVAYLGKAPVTDDEFKSLSGHQAVNAYLKNQDIIVEMSDGCVGILKVEGEQKLGSPLISSDGLSVAFTVREFASCRLLTVDLKNGERQEFGNCPSDII